MQLRLCSRCKRPTPNRPAMCDDCLAKAPAIKRETNRLYDGELRDARAAAFYHSTAWRKSRNAYLASIGYICEDCKAEVILGLRSDDNIQLATDVHHVIPLSADWSRRLDWSNFRGLCDRHHKEKRRKVVRGGGCNSTG